MPDKAAVYSAHERVSYTIFNNMVAKIIDAIDRSTGTGEDVLLIPHAPSAVAFAAICAAQVRGIPALPCATSEVERNLSTINENGILVVESLQNVSRHQYPTITARRLPFRGSCIIYKTSGTTGVPRLVPHTFGSGPGEHRVAVFPQYESTIRSGPHIMNSASYHLGTLGPALYSLHAGAGVALLNEWSLGAFEAFAAETSASSSFLNVDMLAQIPQASNLAIPGIRLIMHGGAPISIQLKSKVLDALDSRVLEYYGTSRGTISEIFDDDWLQYPGSVGKPYRTVEVNIESTAESVSDRIGVISVTRRLGRRKHIEYPGDYGYMADEMLYIVERTDINPRDAVSLNAIRRLPFASEVALIFSPSGQRLWVIESPSGRLTDRQLTSVKAVLDTSAKDVVYVAATGSIPRNANGKVRRDVSLEWIFAQLAHDVVRLVK